MRVFLAGAHFDESALVRRVLLELGAEVVDAHDVVAGAAWSEQITRWADDVDAAVAVLPDTRGARYESVLVEVGIALGRGLPLLVLVGDDPAPVPLLLPDVPSARTNFQNVDALRFRLDLFLRRLTTETASAPWHAEAEPVDVEELRRSLDHIRESPSSGRGQRYEAWVVGLFRSAGAEAVIPRNPDDRGFDLVAALPGVSPEPGPLVVEVKATARPQHLMDAALRLQHQVLRERAGLGLLLFEDRHVSSAFAFPTVPMVVAMGLNELPISLERHDGSLSRVLRAARNEAVHRL